MLGFWDYFIMIFYFVFICSIGLVFKRLNKNISDYFRGSGKMLWWIAGISAYVSVFTAWSFTAGAARCYQTGILLPVTYLCSISALVVIYFFLAHRFRRTRAITVCDIIRRRYGTSGEQFMLWLSIPAGLLNGAIGLHVIALFVSSAMGVNMYLTIIVMAVTVTVMSMSGGRWAVAASDFVQMLVILVITITICVYSMNIRELDGISGFISKLPPRITNWSLFERPVIVFLWLGSAIVLQLINASNMNGQGQRYLTVKNEPEARKMTLLIIVCSMFTPWIFFLPVLVATIIFPTEADIATELAKHGVTMQFPREGVYLALANKLLPSGMMGMLVCGMFAASMSTMDTALNANAGNFVKNFYNDILRPKASEKELLRAGQIFTVLFGAMMLAGAWYYTEYRRGDNFVLGQFLWTITGMPLVIPLVMGLLYRRTPSWSFWSTAIFGLVISLILKNLDVNALASLFGFTLPLNKLEYEDLYFIFANIFILPLSFGWFMFTTCFYRKKLLLSKSFPYLRLAGITSGGRNSDEVEKLFADMRTPLEKEDDTRSDNNQYLLIGGLCLIYGSVVMLCALIPNPLTGRIAFLGSGGGIAGIGGILYLAYRLKNKRKHQA